VNPCITVKSYRNSQQDATVHRNLLFHVYIKLNMFRATHRPSSGAQNCTSSLWFCIRERLLDVEVGGRGRLPTASTNLNVYGLCAVFRVMTTYCTWLQTYRANLQMEVVCSLRNGGNVQHPNHLTVLITRYCRALQQITKMTHQGTTTPFICYDPTTRFGLNGHRREWQRNY